MGARAILVDTDPGQDDAIALLLAFACPGRLDLRGITTVAGNVGVAQTTANALRVRDLAGRADVPVHAGMDRPLLAALETAEFVCGPDGLEGAGLPPPRSAAAPGHAVQALVAAVRAAPPGELTLCALGPLTNLAMALRLAPDIGPRIREIALMGGAMALGNMTPAAEFNVYVDPHAAAIVLGAGVPITLFGLHVTHQALASPAHIARLAETDAPAIRSVHGMLTRPRPSRLDQGGLDPSAHPMHDPCVIAWLLWPELFTGRNCHVAVQTEGELRGRTTIDWNGRWRRPANAFVPDTVDATRLFDRLIDALATLNGA